jgi:pyrimidine operon attenuation protein/uracil phosphoribosyltransferase
MKNDHGETHGRVLQDADDIRRTLTRIAHEILERNPDPSRLALVGIHTRGLFVAQRLFRHLQRLTGDDVGLGSIDITFHRDDVAARAGAGAAGEPRRDQPVVRGTRLDFDVEGATVVLCDDVLSTGRTIRAGIEALFEYGRPAAVQLAVLVDRGHRELPIRPDFVGKNLPTPPDGWVQVELVEHDEVDRIVEYASHAGRPTRSHGSPVLLAAGA